MRLFTGLALPHAAAAPLLALHPLADLRWTSEEKLHITTKFIGEWPESRLEELQRALEAVRASPVEVRVRGLDWLATTLCARVEATEELRALAAATEAALEPIGIVKEARIYRPHVTLARPRKRTALAAPGLDIRFQVKSFYLYLSGSGKYTRLNEFPFTPA